MAHAWKENITPATSTNCFNIVWEWVVAMLKAGALPLASSDASTKDATGYLENCKWAADSVALAGAAAASVAAAVNGRAIVTGLSGLTSAHVGCRLRLSGGASAVTNHDHLITRIISTSSCEIRAMAPCGHVTVSDANNGSITWSVRDPQGTYPSGSLASANGAWILLQLAGWLKVPFTVAPTATFARGARVTQVATGFEGMVVSVTVGSATGIGYLVIAPTVRGSGAGVWGLDDGEDLTAGSATVTQDGTALQFDMQVMVAKAGNETNGTLTWGVFDLANESDALSQLVAAAGCTATVAPGQGGTGNAFSTYGRAMLSTTASMTHAPWCNANTAISTLGNGQVCVANLIPNQDDPADGSSALAIHNASGDGFHFGFGFAGLDNTEPGDVEPVVSFNLQIATLYSESRTSATSSSNTTQAYHSVQHTAARQFARGWWRRGRSDAAFVGYESGALYGLGSTSLAFSTNVTTRDTVSSSEDREQTFEPVVILRLATTLKQRKGTCRWLGWTQGGAAGRVYAFEQGYFVQVGAAGTTGAPSFPMCIGPTSAANKFIT